VIYTNAEPLPRLAVAAALGGPPPTTRLGDRAMTVALHLRGWTGSRLDRAVTREVLDERRAAGDAGRFEKKIVPPKALEAVTRAHSSARARHYALTLPWGEESVRILSASAFFEWQRAMNQERTACEKAHAEFCAAYPQLVASAPARLADLYDASDFPAASVIREKFSFRLVVMPVPDKNDFRVNLGSEIEAEIRSSIETTVRSRYVDAQHDLWARLLDTLKHFAGTMHQEGKVFRNTTVTKLAELARVAPLLSLAPDPRLTDICGEILALTQGLEPNDLRQSKPLRKRAAAEAQAAVTRIQEAMAGAF
jgi:hypothetical protein